MYFKVLCFIVIIAAAVAQEGQHHEEDLSAASIIHHNKHLGMHEYAVYHGEGYHGHHHHHHHRHHIRAHPNYEFEYRIEDHNTGDIKSQNETRHGDIVEGFYALHQPAGHERAVHYNSDHVNGFNADVNYRTHHHYMPKYHH